MLEYFLYIQFSEDQEKNSSAPAEEDKSFVTLSNDTILRFIEDCISKDITNIHLFAFVFNVAAGGINEEDFSTMIYIKRHFPRLAPYMAIISTNCEDLSTKRRQHLTDEFFKHPRVVENKLNDYFQKKILYMGCLTQETYDAKDEKALEKQYHNVSEMRKTFIETCIGCTKPFNIYRDRDSCTLS